MKTENLDKFDLSPLDSYNLEKVTASIVFDTRREKENGCYPVKYRVTYNQKQQYYPAMDLLPKEFDALHKAVKGKNQIRTKKLIISGFKRITDLIEDIVQKEGFTLEALAMRLKRGTADSILDAFDNKVADLQSKGKIGTSVWYSCAKNSIEKFITKDIKFADVTPAWLEKYEDHLLKEGKEYTTISINMRALRAIVNDGKASGIITEAQYPFVVKDNGKYQIPEGSGRKIALNSEQLMKVFNFKIMPENEKYRDLWVFSFYCNGANISDVLKFKYENIIGNYIEWYRTKTVGRDKEKKKIRAVITEEMQTIINKYGNPDKKGSNYIFPYLNNGLTPIAERMTVQNVTHTINKKMKKIGQALGYGDITTYWARHSWASISRHQGVSLFGISKGMGHKDLSTTQIYLDSLSDDELTENAKLMPRRNK